MYGRNACGLHGFRNKGIDIVELCIGKFEIHSSQRGNALCNRRPGKTHIIVNPDIEIPLQGFYRLLMASEKIGFIHLVIGSVSVNFRIGIPINGAKLNLSCPLVHRGKHNHVGKCTGLLLSFPIVQSENGNRAIGLSEVGRNKTPEQKKGKKK